jgi:predicted RecA/RadA family phage recombinase
MATNYIQPGDVLTLTAPSGGVTAGAAVKIGSLIVVPTSSAAQTLPFEGALSGVFTLAKATGTAWTVGATLYFDTANANFVTAQSATACRAGHAVAAAASGDATGQVRLLNIGAVVNVA